MASPLDRNGREPASSGRPPRARELGTKTGGIWRFTWPLGILALLCAAFYWDALWLPGGRIIEAGTGSGGLTVALARAIGSQGKLYSYEARADILRLAMGNLERLGLETRIEFKQRDIIEGFDETDIDAVFLDVRQPWRYLGHVSGALRPSGFLGARCLQR